NFFKHESGLSARQVSRHMLVDENRAAPDRIKILTKSAILPSEEEVKTNRRSRSAKMRVAEMLIKD
ncbi:MAG: 16S rRNA (cytosine(1402)-N(4))-methyltransferase, partial [Alphaproteobacteria bacterium]|nr:16S rRNA (cytosine(1402)-N(4))-methyltransferase [Alphaproteobacteria bacterium]